MRYVIATAGYAWNVLELDGRKATVIATTADEGLAVRIAELLEMHGRVAVTLPEGLEP